jgi:heterodisulfide reductase subunit A
VTIVGGGIAGLTAAWELSHFDLDIHLIEKDYFLGGHALQYNCKAVDKCEQCDACTVEKMLKNVMQSPKIHIYLAADIKEITHNTLFHIQILQKPLFSTQEEQEFLGQAFAQCPIENLILRGSSVWNLPLYALNHDQLAQLSNDEIEKALNGHIASQTPPQNLSLETDAVIIATGFQPFNPSLKSLYNYDQLPNVVTALEMETAKKEKGIYLRPSDTERPKRTAFIQCVGSRNEEFGHLWCSQVCCPYALRMAQVMRSEDPEMDITFYYMDIQNIGKDSPVFYEKCLSDFHFIRNIPVDISSGPDGSVSIRFLDDHTCQALHEVYDLVILSVGISPGPDNERLANLCNISLHDNGFFQGHPEGSSSLTKQKGVFLAGTVTGPKSIAESVVHTGQTVHEVVKYLGVEK